MNLIIDIGNSSTKIAVYEGGQKKISFATKDFSCEKVEKKLAPFRLDKAIVSSVRNTPEFVIDLLTVNIPSVHVLSHMSKFPFSVEYETIETLGTDRLAAVAGAFSLYGNDNILVIDAGTAVTYDFLCAGVYKGGNISPGLSMRFRALNRFTGRLPLVSPGADFSNPGRNTNDAIEAGVITGAVYEINEYIRTFEKEFRKSRVLLTGGDSLFIGPRLEENFSHMPDLVLDGLNYILEYNV